MWPQGVLFLVKLEAAQSSGSLLLTRLCGDFDCIGSLAAISPELGVFPEAISEDLQKLAEESRAHRHLTRPLGWDHQKARSGGRRLAGMSNRYIQMELLLRAGLYQNRPAWPVTSTQQIFLQEQGQELPHSDARKWDFARPTISQTTHLSVPSTSPEVNQADKGEPF